jgi:putative tricarboxylic transport membrane protein
VLGVFFHKIGRAGAVCYRLVLGPLMHENFRRAMYLSRGDPLVFLERPISALLLALALALLIILILPAVRGKREEVFRE